MSRLIPARIYLLGINIKANGPFKVKLCHLMNPMMRFQLCSKLRLTRRRAFVFGISSLKNKINLQVRATEKGTEVFITPWLHVGPDITRAPPFSQWCKTTTSFLDYKWKHIIVADLYLLFIYGLLCINSVRKRV